MKVDIISTSFISLVDAINATNLINAEKVEVYSWISKGPNYLRTVDIHFKTEEDELAFVLTHGNTLHYEPHDHDIF